ncbi:MAG: hypothetical protein AMK71_03610 [Nitrospira bacterium SG8_35_4]|nr:MAG: hypothetical protein AMK71_03610 [Nitrospira bacterium SG8_35_4]
MLNYLVKRISLTVIVMFTGLLMTDVHAESRSSQEYKVKSAFIYNFTKFIEWPAESFTDDTTINFCIIGDNPFGDDIQTIKGKTVKERELTVRQIKSIEDTGECNILFVSSSEKKNVSAILEQIKEKHILSIADMDGFARRGGIINFIMMNNKIHFEINVKASKLAGIQISSKLLKLAQIIE